MSTKLNAEELAAKRWPDWAIKKSRITSVDEAEIPKLKTYSIREGYAAAIREVAQPLADERDAYREALECAVARLDRILGLMSEVALMTPTQRMSHDDYVRKCRDEARAILAKYPKP